MKLLQKKFSLLIIGIMLLAIGFGCTPKETFNSNISSAFGYIESLSTTGEEEQSLNLDVNGEILDLEVKDKEIYDSLEEGEYYMVSYDDEHILLSIKTNSYLKDLVLNSLEDKPEGSNQESIEIPSVDRVSLEHLSLLDEYTVDFDKDGNEDRISMYTSAEKGPDGKPMWDDGQRWLFVAHTNDKDYVLFDDYVQLGTINFHIYTIEDDFYISTINSGTANLTLSEFKFDQEKDMFIKTVPFDTVGNVNKLHTSFGY